MDAAAPFERKQGAGQYANRTTGYEPHPRTSRKLHGVPVILRTGLLVADCDSLAAYQSSQRYQSGCSVSIWLANAAATKFIPL